jgi:DNA invertase Pin-like site-specific DNA recombinase
MIQSNQANEETEVMEGAGHQATTSSTISEVTEAAEMIKKQIHKGWTATESQFLIDNRESMTLEEIAVSLDRTVASVRGRMKRMSLFRNKVTELRSRERKIYAKWTPEEDLKLQQLLATKEHTCVELAIILNRSEGSVRQRIRDKKWPPPKSLGKHNFYTAEEEETIKQLLNAGHSLDEIAFRLKRSVRAIQGKLIHMEKTK